MKIILIGSNGAMGKVVISLAQQLGHEIVLGLHSSLTDVPGFPVKKNFRDLDDYLSGQALEASVIIDFSTSHLTDDLLDFALKHNLPILLATTGHSADQEEKIKRASHSIGILNTNNTSIGVNIMQEMAAKMTRILYPLGYDVEIVEKHHRYKKDSPSGTAKMLLEAVESGMDESPVERHGREGNEEQRPHNEIGIHAIRAGDIVGEHSIIFANNQETLEIKHQAGSKELFARGALAGAEFLVATQRAGLYDMKDVWQ